MLPGHAPLLALLGAGELWYRQGAQRHYLAIAFGFAEVQPDRVTILAQIAERAEEIDVARAEAAKKRAEQRLASPPIDMDAERARIALLKSLIRLQVATAHASLIARCRLHGSHEQGALRRLPSLSRNRLIPAILRSCNAQCAANLRQPATVPRPHPEPGRARAEGALPRLGPRVPLVVHQPAAAARDLLLRLHDDHAEPGRRASQPYALFMLCGILPWTWFSASLTEASGSLIAGGNLIKKVLFPAEVLPIVSVLANMVHFFLALPIWSLLPDLIYRHWPDAVGSRVVSGGRARAADVHDRPRARRSPR